RPSPRQNLLPSHIPSHHQRQNAQWAARPLLDLQGRRNDDGALRRQQVQVCEALQPKPSFTMHIKMGGIRRIEVLALTEIGTDRLGAESMHITLLDKPLYDGSLWSRRGSANVAQSHIVRISLL